MENRLKNPPIVEALLEIQWELKSVGALNPTDPYFQLLVGSFYEKIKSQYPFYEPLPASTIPDDITGPVVKHRFRVAKDGWPLVQIGPGIMSVNQTEKYGTFGNFKPLAIQAVNTLIEAYPAGELKIISVLLRYIDAKELDYSQENICEFLTEKMHIPLEMPSFLFMAGKLEPFPLNLNLKSSFRCNEPPGTATLSISTGHKEGKRAVIWDQMLKSTGDDVPNMGQNFETWIDQVHLVIDAWFWKLIEGDLREEFDQ